MKIGIIGGTFDPVHYGHLLLAQTACEKLDLDKVLFIPAGNPYFKSEKKVSSKEDRSNLVKLAIEGNEKFEYSDIEIERDGNTYTIDTLKELKEKNPENEYHLIIGSDTLFEIRKWLSVGEIFKLAGILVIARTEVLNDVQSEINNLRADFPDAVINRVFMPRIDISSTMLRSYVAENKSIKYYTPDTVVNYIKEHNLYED